MRQVIRSQFYRPDGTAILLALLALAFTLRVVVVLSVGLGLSDRELLEVGGGDGGGYYELARSILDGDGFSHPLFILRPPGLPLIEAGLFGITGSNNPWLVLGLSTVASSLTVVATVVLAETLGAKRPYSLLAGLIIAIEPASIYYGVTPLTEPLFTLVLIALLAVVVKVTRADEGDITRVVMWTAVAGLLLSVAILIKPLALGLVIVVAAGFVAKYKKRVLTYSLVLVLPITFGLAWATSNLNQFDNFTFSNSFSYNVLFLKTPLVLHTATGKPEEQIRLELIDELAERRNVQFAPGTVHYDFLTETDSRTLSEMNAIAFEAWLENPTANVRPAATGTYSMLFKFRESTLLNLSLAPLRLALYIAALAGIVALWRFRLRMAAAVLFAVISYVVLVNVFALGVGDLRLAVPIYPVLAVLSAVALQQYMASRRTTSRIATKDAVQQL